MHWNFSWCSRGSASHQRPHPGTSSCCCDENHGAYVHVQDYHLSVQGTEVSMCSLYTVAYPAHTLILAYCPAIVLRIPPDNPGCQQREEHNYVHLIQLSQAGPSTLTKCSSRLVIVMVPYICHMSRISAHALATMRCML